MDEEIKALLKEIALELRERNHLTRQMSDRSEARMKEMDSMREQMGLGASRQNRLKEMMERGEEQTAKLQQSTEERNAERRQFQTDLLSELRRMNSYLEALARASH